MPENPITALWRRRSTDRAPGATGDSPPRDLAHRYAALARSSAALVAHSRATRRALALRLLIALGCGVFALSVGRSSARASDLRAKWGSDVPVLVALTDIAPGDVVTRSSVRQQRRPAALVPAGAVPALPDGATAVSLILKGDLLLSGRLADGEGGIAPRGTTAIRLDLAVTAPELSPGNIVDVLGPDRNGEPGSESSDAATGPEHRESPFTNTRVEVISRDAVVLRPPDDTDPTVEVAVPDGDLETVAAAALDGRVVVVRHSP